MLSVNSNPTITTSIVKPQGVPFKSRNYYQHLTETKEFLKKIIDIEKKPAIERTLSDKELLKKFENNLAEIQKLFREFGDKCKTEPLNLEIGERLKCPLKSGHVFYGMC